MIGRNVGLPTEHIQVIELAAAGAADIDMSTVVVIGSSTTAVVPGRPLASSVFTSRRHPGT